MTELETENRLAKPDLLTPTELCERWEIDRRTLARWMATGRIPGTNHPVHYVGLGRKLRFSFTQVKEMEAAMEAVAKPRRKRKPKSAAA